MGWREPVRSWASTATRNPWVLPVALLVVALVELAFLDGLERRGVAVAMAPVITLPLAWRRRAPLVVAVTVSAGFAAQTIAGVSDSGQNATTIALLVATFCLGRYGQTSAVVAGSVMVSVIGAVGVASTPDDTPSDYAFLSLITVGTVCAGAVFRRRSDDAQTQAHRAALAEETARERAREAAELERRRIARELHDVVAHAISLMVLQASAAEATLDHRPDDTRQGLRSIQSHGRAALVDMSHLLGLLHQPVEQADLQPHPSLRDLPVLAAQFQAAGVPVDIHVDVPDGRLTPSLEVSIHRIVREGLTNVLRHAGPATASVRVSLHQGAVDVEIRDDGHPAPGNPGPPGHGLIGMRERIALYGGQLAAGPRPDGGYTVHARIPLDTVAANR